MTQNDCKGEGKSIEEKIKKFFTFSFGGLEHPTMDGATNKNNWFLFLSWWRLGEQAMDPGDISENFSFENDAKQI